MRRTLSLLAVVAFCGAGLAYGLPAASGSADTLTPTVHEQLDTTDRPAEPTGHGGIVAPLPQPATGSAAPTSSTAPAPAVTAPAPAASTVEAPVPAAVNPQPVPVADPQPVTDLGPCEIDPVHCTPGTPDDEAHDGDLRDPVIEVAP